MPLPDCSEGCPSEDWYVVHVEVPVTKRKALTFVYDSIGRQCFVGSSVGSALMYLKQVEAKLIMCKFKGGQFRLSLDF